MELTFDRAVEILEITDISKIKIEDITLLEKKAKKRWHPDRVAHLNDRSTTEEYNENFQFIETACQMILSFLNGTYKSGHSFDANHNTKNEEPEELIRENAINMQTTLLDLMDIIRDKKYKHSLQTVTLSDGFKLKDLLNEDFKEDIAMLSIISFFYGFILLGILSAITTAISPIFGNIIGFVWLLQALACILGLAPLSRLWLNIHLQNMMFKFINFGLGIYNWAEIQGQNSTKSWVILLIRLPVLFAKLVKYLILFPLYELTKAFVGKKVLGIVKQNINYYADAAEWYIDELLTKNHNIMTKEELFHLSHIYTELKDVKSTL